MKNYDIDNEKSEMFDSAKQQSTKTIRFNKMMKIMITNMLELSMEKAFKETRLKQCELAKAVQVKLLSDSQLYTLRKIF